MSLRRFEQRLESLVEGTFARVFKGSLTPLEIGRRIARELDAQKVQTSDNLVMVPNHFWIYLSTSDYQRLVEIEDQLIAELVEAAQSHIQDEHYQIAAPVSAALVETPQYQAGTFQIRCQWRQAAASIQPTLLLGSGERLCLTDPCLVGRLPSANAVLNDESVSRSHAVIESTSQGWTIRDLGSTNGTSVNGTRVGRAQLRHGDRIKFGFAEVVFEMVGFG